MNPLVCFPPVKTNDGLEIGVHDGCVVIIAPEGRHEGCHDPDGISFERLSPNFVTHIPKKTLERLSELHQAGAFNEALKP